MEKLKKMERNFQREIENFEKYLEKTKSHLSSSPSDVKANVSEKLAKISEILEKIRENCKLIPRFKKMTEAAEINEEFIKSLDTVCLKVFSIFPYLRRSTLYNPKSRRFPLHPKKLWQRNPKRKPPGLS